MFKKFKNPYLGLIVGFLAALVLLSFAPSNKIILLIFIALGSYLFYLLKDLKKTAFLLYLFFLPFERGATFSLPMVENVSFWITFTFADLSFFFLLFILFRERIVKKKKYKFNFSKSDWWLVLFLIFAFIPIFFTSFWQVSFLAFLRLLRAVSVFVFIPLIFQKEKQKFINFILLTLGASLIFQGVWSVLQFALRSPLGRTIEQIGQKFSPYGHIAFEELSFFRSQGTFVHPNTLASFVGILIPMFFLLILSRYKNKMMDLIYSLAFVFGSIALVLSASRAAWGVVSIILLIEFLFLFLKFKNKIVLEMKRFIWIFILLVVFLPLLIIPRFSHLSSSFQEYGSGNYRLGLIQKSVALSKKYPLGIGLENFPVVLVTEFSSSKFSSDPVPPHNIFAKVLAETGILGFLSFLFFLVYKYKEFFLKLRTNNNLYKIGFLFASLAFLGLASFYPLFSAVNIFDYFWLFLALYSLS